MSSKREHTKSRLGCKQCKRRRIKCDETPPRCENCKKKDMQCDYQDWEDVFRSVQFFAPPALPPTNPRSALETTTRSSTIADPAKAFTSDDLALHYHFIMYTSLTMDCNGERADQLWQREVPGIAQQHPFLMHAVLAFAAVHIVKTGPQQSPRYEQLARHHYGQALTLFRQSVGGFSGEQAEALLCFGIMINFITVNLDKDANIGEKDTIADFAKLFSFLHNSVQMLTPVRQSMRASMVATELRRAYYAVQPQPIEPNANDSLNQLGELALRQCIGPGFDFDRALVIDDALSKLREFYTFVPPHPTSWARILNFPLQLQPHFFSLLQQHDPVALCILAHWVLPLRNAPKRWYFSDRARLLMLAIAGHLQGTEWSEGIRWPLSQTVNLTESE